MSTSTEPHAARLTIDYPDHDLDRLPTGLRVLYAIPILIVLGLLAGTATVPRQARTALGSGPSGVAS